MRLQRCLLSLTVIGLLAACGRAQETVNVKLVFQGLSKSEFDGFASKVAEAVASVAGVPSGYVSMVSSSAGGSSSSSATDTSSNNASNSAGASLLIDGALSSNAVDVRESAPSQLPSTLATAPGYIRAQYTEQTYAAAAAAAAAASGSTSTTPGTSISSAVPKTTTSPTTATANTTSASSNATQHQQHNTANTSTTGSSNSTHNVNAPQTGLVSTPIVPLRISASVLDRKLLAVESTIVEYAIKTNASEGPWADAAVIRKKVLSSAAGFGQASSAGFGKGFYATLDKSGVPYQPTVYLDGVKILAGGLSTEAPRSRFGQRHEDEPKVFDPSALANANGSTVIELRDVRPVALPSESAAGQQTGLAPWLIGVIVAAGVIALALGGVLVWKCCCCRRNKRPDTASQGSSQNQFISGGTEGSQV